MITNATRKEPALPTGDELQVQAQTFFHDATIWMQSHWLNILIASGIAIAIFFALHAVRRWGLHMCKRGAGVANWYSILGRAVSKTGHFFILMTSIKLVSGYANPPAMVASTVSFLFTIAAVFQAAIWLREFIFGAVEHKTSQEDYQGTGLSSAIGIIRMLVTIVLFAIATVVVLSNLGVNVTGLVAGLGIGGIAIGLAAQGIFADLFAALAIIFDKPFRIGDNIAFSSSKGKVERIGLKSTRIRGPNGEERIIANKKLLDYELLNNSNREYRRVTLTIRLAYTTPGEKAAMVPDIVRAAVESEGCIFGKAWLADFAQSSMNFDIEFDSPSPSADAADEKKHRVAMEILKRFDAEGINFFAPLQAAQESVEPGE
ncbi:mechanosensitive ion channel family protein [Sphingomonas soli]|uniref:mechanosensitive ion channel family protein n=1 Tax=Sphingomonas soli TaxID=266127 RepID=UPI0008326184|nr:mechanosensitive ion channel domain-containing protein [Sphingomonas soli]